MGGICAAIARTDVPVDVATLDLLVRAAPHRSGGRVDTHVEAAGALASLGDDAGTGASSPHLDVRPGTVTVTHARIDNVVELRRRLGNDAPSRDSGVAALVGAAYERWGVVAFSRLIGDFACLVWDRRRGQIVLARDPMAMRPLYVRVEPRRILVASEVTQLLAVPGVPAEPDERMVAAYLAGCFGDLSWTFYDGISQVPPSHAVTVGPHVVRTTRYWDVDRDHTIHYTSQLEYAEHLRHLLIEAVDARLAGPRPAGVLLSGGLDSGAAASAAGWLTEQGRADTKLYSYSWDYGSLRQCDERHISRHIVDRYGLTSRDIPVEDAGPFAGYPAHGPGLDDPFHGHFQTMLDRGFASAAADGVGPLFTGMRGDLAIGPMDVGYDSLLAAGRLGALATELRIHRRATGQPRAALRRDHLWPAASAAARGSAGAAWLRWAVRRSASRPPRRPAARREGTIPPWIRRALVKRVGLDELVARYADSPAPPLHGPFRRRRYQWLFMPMHLRWAVSHERRAARYGMEAVDPWSDRRIAEFCLAIPQQVSQRPEELDKRLARQALRGIAPDAFLEESRKIVPGPLYVSTLRSTAVPTVHHLLTDSHAAAVGWLDPEPLRRNFDQFVAGGPLAPQFWWALSLEWWLRVRAGSA